MLRQRFKFSRSNNKGFQDRCRKQNRGVVHPFGQRGQSSQNGRSAMNNRCRLQVARDNGFQDRWIIYYWNMLAIEVNALRGNSCKSRLRKYLRHGGEGGIRTPGRSFGPYNGLANLSAFLTRSENCWLYSIPQAVTMLPTCAVYIHFDWIWTVNYCIFTTPKSLRLTLHIQLEIFWNQSKRPVWALRLGKMRLDWFLIRFDLVLSRKPRHLRAKEASISRFRRV